MIDFEDRLRQALRRQAPPPGFTERVLARAAASGGRSVPSRNWRRWAAVPLAASVLLAAAALERSSVRQERERGQAARGQLLAAMRITSGKLNKIEKKVRGVWK